jgi:hypothetical protein
VTAGTGTTTNDPTAAAAVPAAAAAAVPSVAQLPPASRTASPESNKASKARRTHNFMAASGFQICFLIYSRLSQHTASACDEYALTKN